MIDACGVVEWAVAAAPLEGETVSGDAYVVAPFPDGVLVAVVDGLGPGPEAAVAARAATEVMAKYPADEPLALIRRCHDALRTTRGAVMSVASLDTRSSRMTWAGVGNVEGMLLRASTMAFPAREALMVRGGVVGKDNLPPLRSAAVVMHHGDALVMATDGVRSGFGDRVKASDDPDQTAQALLRDYTRGNDDACALVARYRGGWSSAATVRIRDDSDVAMARKLVRETALSCGLQHVAGEALATAVSELAHNILAHAVEGEVCVGEATREGRRGVLVVARDRGRGIPDVDTAMTDGYTSTGTLGLGLPSARRLVDELEVITAANRGTTIILRKWAA